MGGGGTKNVVKIYLCQYKNFAVRKRSLPHGEIKHDRVSSGLAWGGQSNCMYNNLMVGLHIGSAVHIKQCRATPWQLVSHRKEKKGGGGGGGGGNQDLSAQKWH